MMSSIVDRSFGDKELNRSSWEESECLTLIHQAGINTTPAEWSRCSVMTGCVTKATAAVPTPWGLKVRNTRSENGRSVETLFLNVFLCAEWQEEWQLLYVCVIVFTTTFPLYVCECVCSCRDTHPLCVSVCVSVCVCVSYILFRCQLVQSSLYLSRPEVTREGTEL